MSAPSQPDRATSAPELPENGAADVGPEPVAGPQRPPASAAGTAAPPDAEPVRPAHAEPRARRAVPGWWAAREFLRKAWYENFTGSSAMVAYNLLLAIFPLGLLALFVFGQVLESPRLEAIAVRDLRDLFPAVADSTIRETLDGVRRSSTSFGIFALVASLWIGSSFWGALDTAFSQIYHVKPRSWIEQKRFGVAMIVVVLLFMAATVFVPTVQSIFVSGANDLPFGLAEIQGLIFVLTLGGGLLVLFALYCLVFWTVPNRRVPWRAVWPGALGATVATGIVDYGFPLYLTRVSTLAQASSTFVFILVVLIWFYVLAAILLGGAIVNAIRLGTMARPPAASGDATGPHAVTT